MTVTIKLNKDKNIGKVLFVVEGGRTEFSLLKKVFTQIFDYQLEQKNRMEKYRKYNEKEDIESSIFVVNTEESAIKFVDNDSEFLNSLFTELINTYKFPVDRAAIFYIFDRDVKSNTDRNYIEDLLRKLGNSRDANGFDRQGLLLLSYPAVESFVLSNFVENVHEFEYETGSEVKSFLNEKKINQHNISEVSLLNATQELLISLRKIGVYPYDLDNFSITNINVFEYQEGNYGKSRKYKLLSLLAIAFLDLGMLEVC